MNPASRAVSRRGFNLVEILVTVVVLGIIITPITRLVIFTVWGTGKTVDHVVAFTLAKEKMERLRLLPFEKLERETNDLWSEEELSADPNAEEFRKEYRARFGIDHVPSPADIARFEREVEVDPGVDTVHKDSRLKRGSVVVRRKGGGEELCALVTLFSRY